MKIGIPKEIKNNESRVGMTPAGVFELTKKKHTVFVQTTAGEGSGFFDKDYQEVGATILLSIEEVYSKSEMIIKVKEPIASEYPLIKENQIVFTYFHFAQNENT
jgi:alanine dehydrogenase